jgi:hypothetical protein
MRACTFMGEAYTALDTLLAQEAGSPCPGCSTAWMSGRLRR